VTGAGRAWLRLALGLGLTAAFWWLSWQPVPNPLVRGWFFFGLWLGYILTVDGLCTLRTGSSPASRGARAWLLLFLVSAPAWWLFEFLNGYLRNWEYLGIAAYTGPQHAFFSTLSFSTVVPAVVTTGELLASLGVPKGLARGPRLPMTPRALSIWIGLGLLGLAGVVAAPRFFFPATWLAVFFVLDPINHLAGRPSVAGRVERGDWGLVAILGAAALTCGLFWELWNYHAWPKWVYHVPFVGFAKVFEMPLLGYLGYIPFGLEIYALYYFLIGLATPHVRWPLPFDADLGQPGAQPNGRLERH
jgi:hypothetical protein